MTTYEKFKQIESLRLSSKHDLYVIAGQLSESNIDPIDSWTFFKWLQEHGIPSVYILKKEDHFYKEAQNHKDVIALDTYTWGGYELLSLTEVWARACAFVVEWDLGGGEVDAWLKRLPDCRYVFLQHGVIGTCIRDILLYPCRNIYNDVNVFSLKEKKVIEGEPATHRCFIAGLPRFDAYRPTPGKKEKTVFIMFTWRAFFSENIDKLQDSTYWQAIKSISSHPTVAAAQKSGIKFVMALHHSLVRNANEATDFNGISFVEQREIQKWIRQADAFITDFSSVAHDFMFQNKPVIFFLPDKDDPIYEQSSDRAKLDSAAERRKEYFNCTDNIEDTMALLQKYIDNGFTLEPENIKISETYFCNRENLSQHVYECIEERLTAERDSYQYWLSAKEEWDSLIEKRDSQINERIRYSQHLEDKIHRIRKKRKMLITGFAIILIIQLIAIIGLILR